MSYEIKPQNVKSFIEDRNIKLPRFQRKQTWNDKKNFLLTISIFKGYPLGVTILNIEGKNAETTRWLLDGRQRRNALTIMSEDPERIYYWSKSFIGFKNTDQIEIVEELYWEKVNEYIESDSDTEALPPVGELEADLQVQEMDIQTDTKSKEGLELLLTLICACHNTTIKGTNFTRPFDFSEYLAKELPYQNTSDPARKLSSRKLRSFINEYISYCKLERLSQERFETFLRFSKSRFFFKDDSCEQRYCERLERSWQKISERIAIVDSIDRTLLLSEIGLIEVSNITTSDAQKIFNIINTGGSALTAAEILSAKPAWNKKVENPSSDVIAQKNELYKIIGTEQTDVVKWDLAATIVPRIVDQGLLFTEFDEKSVEKRISMGFKILSGIYLDGVKKEDIDKLSSHPIMSDLSDFEDFVLKLNLLLRVVNELSFFGFVRSWKKSLQDLTSDAILLNYIQILFRDFTRKGFEVSNTNAQKLKKNAFVLFDRMIFEYSKRAWRGSSDSIIAKNISSFSINPDVFEPVDESKWRGLIDDIFQNSQIEGVPVEQRAVTPILYYYYFLMGIPNINPGSEIEVDHIYPKSVFESSALPNKDLLVNNLCNLQLLPKRENISKSDKPLSSVTDNWLKTQIKISSGIDDTEYILFSNLSNFELLRNRRHALFIEAFTVRRNTLLNNA